MSNDIFLFRFLVDNTNGSKNNKRSIFSDTKSIARMCEDSLMQPCVIIANLQNILGIRLEDVYHASC